MILLKPSKQAKVRLGSTIQLIALVLVSINFVSKMSKITKEQKEILLEFMEVNYAQVMGKFASQTGKANKADKWNDLTILLNQIGPPFKSWEQWNSE